MNENSCIETLVRILSIFVIFLVSLMIVGAAAAITWWVMGI